MVGANLIFVLQLSPIFELFQINSLRIVHFFFFFYRDTKVRLSLLIMDNEYSVQHDHICAAL